MKNVILLLLISFVYISFTSGQETASTVEPPRTVDKSFNPKIDKPAYAKEKGPVVIIDESHNNFHTAKGRYSPFALTLEKDGYIVKRGVTSITQDLLKSCSIYVIADAQPPAKVDDPPTFSTKEIEILNAWVKDGGALFLITDHKPDPAAIEKLAKSFGIQVNNGYALNGALSGREQPLVFDRSNGSLIDNKVTNGRNSSEKVSKVATFAGSAFKAGDGFQAILVFGAGQKSWMPKENWKFPPGTPNISIEGWFQGGVMKYGKGKAAIFSEAAMFTAQVFDNGKVKAGMNSPAAKDNTQLLLNVMHWLSGLL